MSKFGVGVGDDFPVDDGNGQNPGGDQGQPRDDREEFEEWKRRRAAHRAQREQWRAQREEWRDRKRAFKEKLRAAAREFGDDRDGFDRRFYGWHYRRSPVPFFLWPLLGLMIPILIIALLVAIVAAVFKSPFVVIGLVLLGCMFLSFRHHHWAGPGHGHWQGRDRWRGRDGGYDFDLKPTASSTSGPAAPPPSSTPPQDGGK